MLSNATDGYQRPIRPLVNFGDQRLPDRFWDKTIPCPMSGCWLWIASVSVTGSDGYGQFFYGGKLNRAHRVSYSVLVGEIPAGLEIDHLCRNTRCVNPAHLEPVTGWENTKRGTGPFARFAKQTHCEHGHPFSGSNLKIDSKGHRFCRECLRRIARGRRARRAALGVCVTSPTHGVATRGRRCEACADKQLKGVGHE